MFKFGLPLAVLLASASPVLAQAPKVKPETRILHENLIVLDTHFDTPANEANPSFDIRVRNKVEDGSQVDYPRMVDGGVDGGFFVVFTPQGANTKEGNIAARDHALLARRSEAAGNAVELWVSDATVPSAIAEVSRRFGRVKLKSLPREDLEAAIAKAYAGSGGYSGVIEAAGACADMILRDGETRLVNKTARA